ncbi:helix-turn-helix transcriptional regulator [Parabacteroides sp.]|uniref:helix-turn-helix transcriptional regulator n=1 Tax=Parabacteroides sp. TaxID=1869337 RepID=UPI00257E583A|nr:helix-turn-helix transcriptional regulator [Parabacteroides sp.]
MKYQVKSVRMRHINRLKVVLVEKQKTGKWLAEQLGKDPATVSRWCSNSIQPSVETFAKIADLLNVDIKELFNSSK